MRTNRCLWLLALLLLLPFSGAAQRYLNLASFRAQGAPAFGYREQAGETTLRRYSASLLLPIQTATNNAWLIGGDFSALMLEHNLPYVPQFPGVSRRESTRVFQFSGSIGRFQRFGEQWSGTFLFFPKISSDFLELSMEDLQFGGMALLSKQVRPSLKWSFGLYYNTEFFAPFLVPLVGVDWKASERWRLYGVLPGNFSIERMLSPKLYAGGRYAAPTQSFRLSSTTQRSRYLHESHFGALFLYADYYLTKMLAVNVSVGYTAWRNYRVFEKDDRQDLNMWGLAFGQRSDYQPEAFARPKDGLLVEFGIFLRYDQEAPQEVPEID